MRAVAAVRSMRSAGRTVVGCSAVLGVLAALAAAIPSAVSGRQTRPGEVAEPPTAGSPASEADTLREAIRRTRASSDAPALAEAHNAYGLLHWREARYDSAVTHLHRARQLWTALGDSAGLGRVNNNLGVTHYQWGNLGLALDAFQRSLEIRRALGDVRGTSLVLGNIGLTFRDWGLHDRARDASLQAVTAADRDGDPWVRGYARNSLGLALLGAGDLAGARAAFQESLAVYESGDARLTDAQVRSGQGLVLHGLARVEFAEGRPERAAAMLEPLFTDGPEEARTARQAGALVDLGAAYQATGRSDRAVRILELALRLGTEAGQRALVLQALGGLSDVHDARGEDGTALAYLRRHDVLRDSIVAQSGQQQVANLEMRAEAERQAREYREQEVLIARQQMAFLLGAGLLLATLLLAAVLVHFNRQGRAQRRLMAATNEALEKTNQELRAALAEVHTLEGLIPICARCKKVRDDQGFWESVESYISSRSAALFSHGICNECGPELYGDLWKPAEVGAAGPPDE